MCSVENRFYMIEFIVTVAHRRWWHSNIMGQHSCPEPTTNVLLHAVAVVCGRLMSVQTIEPINKNITTINKRQFILCRHTAWLTHTDAPRLAQTIRISRHFTWMELKSRRNTDENALRLLSNLLIFLLQIDCFALQFRFFDVVLSQLQLTTQNWNNLNMLLLIFGGLEKQRVKRTVWTFDCSWLSKIIFCVTTLLFIYKRIYDNGKNDQKKPLRLTFIK